MRFCFDRGLGVSPELSFDKMLGRDAQATKEERARMKLGLINSAFAQANKGTKFGIEQTKRIGFDTVDIFTDPLDIDAKERKLIKDTARKLQLPIKSVCCVAVGLVDFNPSVQRFSVERVKKFLDMTEEFGADNLLLVIGEYIWEQQVIPPAAQWQTAVDNVRECGRHAK